MTPPLEYGVTARRLSADGSSASCKEATLLVDTSLGGRPDAFNPAELLLASVAACMLKGIERVSPMLRFEFRTVEIEVHGVRQDKPPRMTGVSYRIVVDTDESDHRLELLHQNVRKFGTISNTIAEACPLTGTMERSARPE